MVSFTVKRLSMKHQNTHTQAISKTVKSTVEGSYLKNQVLYKYLIVKHGWKRDMKEDGKRIGWKRESSSQLTVDHQFFILIYFYSN